ncbi:hypothetical protein TWF970_001629 [Orbilia oligospora]|uniref:Uncharacterized protein n=1 Tax=Orbilia oligospora TaxID=2813651 RepID=A0A7C8VRX0_ORBOL|nr:hypothetical protein TWF970_001629 [Orbilia oligospora]
MDQEIPDTSAGVTFKNTSLGPKIGVQAGSINVQGDMKFDGIDSAQLQSESQKNKLLSALYKLVEKNRKDRNPDRVEGTCEWFTNHRKFRNWRAPAPSRLGDIPFKKILWVSADPGSGKSVLAKYLVDSVVPSTKSTTTCYFFFKDDFEGQGSAVTALCCILFQIFDRKPSLLSQEILRRFEIAGEGFCSSLNELWSTLLIVATKESTTADGEIICILDALDECKKEEGSWLMKKLHELYFGRKSADLRLRFLITSRPTRDIRHGFRPMEQARFPLIHLSGENEAEMKMISKEIEIFIEARVNEVGDKLFLTKAERTILLNELTAVPNRTYLWVYLTLNLIENDTETNIHIDERKMIKVISTIPRTVNEAYEKILSRSCNPEQARILLRILVAAERPLTLPEMSLALQLNLKNGHKLNSYDQLQKHPEERIRHDIRDLCGLFIVVLESAVYLIHQTAKEFLVISQGGGSSTTVPSESSIEWGQSLHMPDCHQILFNTCIQHLLFSDFKTHTSERHRSLAARPLEYATELLQTCEFLSYSANHWTTHLEKGQIKLDGENVLDLMKICDVNSTWFKIWFAVYWNTTGAEYPDGMTTLMVASYFGLQDVVKLLLESSSGPNVDRNIDRHAIDNTHGRSALSWAAGNGREGVVAELLGSRSWFKWIRIWPRTQTEWIPFFGSRPTDVGLNSQDRYQRTPLVYAVWTGNTGVIKLLLEAGAAADLSDDIGGTPLSYAICSGRNDVLKLLRESGGIGSKDKISAKLLLSAAENGRYDAVRQLLEIGKIDPDQRGKEDETPLMKAIVGDHHEVARLLITYGADIEAKDPFGRTPLISAVMFSSTEMVKLLLEGRANMEAVDIRGETPLMKATAKKDYQMLQLLLVNGRNIGAKDRNMSLLQAMNDEYWAGAEILRRYGARVESKDLSINRSLITAGLQGNLDQVLILIRNGAAVDTTDRAGNTLLIHAAIENDLELARILVNNGAALDARDSTGNTALIYATTDYSGKMIELLLSARANIDAANLNGHTALSYILEAHPSDPTIRKEKLKIFRLLLREGANMEVVDKDGLTPLLWATENYDLVPEYINVLVNRGANIKTRLVNGTPYSLLYKAIAAGLGWLVDLLLDKGADIEERGQFGPTPLFGAVRLIKPTIARTLLYRGALTEIKGSNGRTLSLSFDAAFVEGIRHLDSTQIQYDDPEWFEEFYTIREKEMPGGASVILSADEINVSNYLCSRNEKRCGHRWHHS